MVHATRYAFLGTWGQTPLRDISKSNDLKLEQSFHPQSRILYVINEHTRIIIMYIPRCLHLCIILCMCVCVCALLSRYGYSLRRGNRA